MSMVSPSTTVARPMTGSAAAGPVTASSRIEHAAFIA
jgi:hypothetical protein